MWPSIIMQRELFVFMMTLETGDADGFSFQFSGTCFHHGFTTDGA
jgi:hypothetical protein